MPCMDGGGDYLAEYRMELKKNNKLTAMLCAVLSAVEKLEKEKEVLLTLALSSRESGVTASEICDWCQIHKEEDKKRRQAEARKKAKEASDEKAREDEILVQAAIIKRAREQKGVI